jgi:hypothetical protein
MRRQWLGSYFLWLQASRHNVTAITDTAAA